MSGNKYNYLNSSLEKKLFFRKYSFLTREVRRNYTSGPISFQSPHTTRGGNSEHILTVKNSVAPTLRKLYFHLISN